MNDLKTRYRIFPVGDSALAVDYDPPVDESLHRDILDRFYYLQQHPLPGMQEVSPAYCSLTIYYDVMATRKLSPGHLTAFEFLKEQVEHFLQVPVPANQSNSKTIQIPVCYDPALAMDLYKVADAKRMTPEKIIELHTSRTYTVYMLGFLPGFAYLGETDEALALPRKPAPENVEAGSVGIAARQTGVYPLASPGGWHIIGRTYTQLFDKDNKDPVLLKAGDQVQFYSISRDEFENH